MSAAEPSVDNAGVGLARSEEDDPDSQADNHDGCEERRPTRTALHGDRSWFMRAPFGDGCGGGSAACQKNTHTV